MAAKLDDTTPLESLLSHGDEVDPLAIFSSIGVRGQKNGTSAMAVLIDHGADVNYVSNTWGTPLMHAVQWKNEEKLRYLLNHGADPTIRSNVTGMTPADLAAKRGQIELYEILQAAEAGETSHTV
jgi:ankyrin repeat protein